MKCIENKKGFTDGVAHMSIVGEREWAERIDVMMKDHGFNAAMQDNDDDMTDIVYGVPRCDVEYFKQCYKAAKKATK